MAVDTYKAPNPGPTFGANAHPVVDAQEAASQDWERGAPVKLVSGLLTECTNAADILANGVGFAVAKASGTTNAICQYYPHDVVPMEFSTDSSSLAQTDVGLVCDLVADSDPTNYWYVDTTVTGGSDTMKIIELVDEVDTAYGRVIAIANWTTTVT